MLCFVSLTLIKLLHIICNPFIKNKHVLFIFNFFDRKIDFDYLNSFDINIKLINFGYFLLHS